MAQPDVAGPYFFAPFLSAAGFFGLRFSLVDLCSLAIKASLCIELLFGGRPSWWLEGRSSKLQVFGPGHKGYSQTMQRYDGLPVNGRRW